MFLIWSISIDLPTLHGIEHRTDLTGEHLLGQLLRSSRGMIDDDDE